MKNKEEILKKYIPKLKELQIPDDSLTLCGGRDTEVDHIKADEILLEILEIYGLHEIVYEFNQIQKWYS